MSAYRDALSHDLQARAVTGPTGGERWLFGVAVVAATAALLLMLSGGGQAGFAALNAWGHYLPAVVWHNITFLGDGLFVLTTLLIFARRYPQVIWTAVLAGLISTLFIQGLKYGLALPRPPAVLDLELMHLIGRGYRNNSFPSGHAASAFTLACLWIYFVRSHALRALLLAVGALAGFSRVFIGVHWPVDVLVAAAAAATSVWLGVLLARHWRWGMRPVGHMSIVLLLTLCAIALLDHDGDYADAVWLAKLTAVLALASFLWHYVVQPVRLRGSPDPNGRVAGKV